VAQKEIAATNLSRPPLPNVTAPAPAIEARLVAPRISAPPLPGAVAAAPMAEIQLVAGFSKSPPLPVVTVPSPTIETREISPRQSAPPLPKVGAAAPVSEIQIVAGPSASLASPGAKAPLPAKETRGEAREIIPAHPAPTAPSVRVAGPEPEKQAPEKQMMARATPALPMPVAIAALPASGKLSSGAPIAVLTPPLARQPAAKGAPLLPMADTVDQAPEKVGSATKTPMVTYRDGQLTIDAQDASLAEVLKLVAEKSGATIEIPPGSGQDRIFEHAGPGPAQEVLASLLNGSPYDFIIVSSPQNPHAPAQVLLSLRGAAPPAAPAPQVAAVQPSVASITPNLSSSPYLYTPPGASSTDVVVPPPPFVTPPKEPIAPDVLEQMMKNYGRQLRGQQPQ
jgi:hypothetical protein